MKIDNDIYQQRAHDWWAEDAAFDIYNLRYCMNPVRYGYFKRKLQGLHLPGKAPLALLRSLRALKKGKMSNQKLAAAFTLCESADLRIAYIGYAIRSLEA